MDNRHCLSRTHLPSRLYEVREKYLKRFRALARMLPGIPVGPGTEFEGLLNMGGGEDEIWVEKGLSEAEKRFVVIHELVHARRQEAGEEFDAYDREEPIVELEAIARAPRRLLRDMPNGLPLVALHEFLTARGRFRPATTAGLIQIHRRICQVLGVASTLACGMPPEAHRKGREAVRSAKRRSGGGRAGVGSRVPPLFRPLFHATSGNRVPTRCRGPPRVGRSKKSGRAEHSIG